METGGKTTPASQLIQLRNLLQFAEDQLADC
jgi:hypothetical protein